MGARCWRTGSIILLSSLLRMVLCAVANIKANVDHGGREYCGNDNVLPASTR